MVRMRLAGLFTALSVLVACGGPMDLGKVADALSGAQPGDTLVVRDGTYTDVILKWEGHASAEKPVVVRPETPGGVRITGASQLKIYGEGLTVNGFLFEKCTAEKSAATFPTVMSTCTAAETAWTTVPSSGKRISESRSS